MRSVLFLCTGNSARSIMAEALLGRLGAGRFAAFSAGSHPKGFVHPRVAQFLQERGFDTRSFRSKSWAEFAGPSAPQLDFVITVCANAQAQPCPIWQGGPVKAHWNVPDPTVGGDDAGFEAAWRLLERRVAAFVAAPFSSARTAPPDCRSDP